MDEIETCCCEGNRRKDGFTGVPQPDGSVWWVCGGCRKPTRPWLTSFLAAQEEARNGT